MAQHVPISGRRGAARGLGLRGRGGPRGRGDHPENGFNISRQRHGYVTGSIMPLHGILLLPYYFNAIFVNYKPKVMPRTANDL